MGFLQARILEWVAMSSSRGYFESRSPALRQILYQFSHQESPPHFLFHFLMVKVIQGFYGGSVVKTPPANAGDMSLIPGLGRSPGEGNDNLLQYSCLGNPTDRRLVGYIVHEVAKELDMT